MHAGAPCKPSQPSAALQSCLWTAIHGRVLPHSFRQNYWHHCLSHTLVACGTCSRFCMPASLGMKCLQFFCASLAQPLDSVSGCRGFGGNGATPRAEVNEGYCHASMPKVDLLFSLDRPLKPTKPFWSGRSLLNWPWKARPAQQQARFQQDAASFELRSSDGTGLQQQGVRHCLISIKVYPPGGSFYLP